MRRRNSRKVMPHRHSFSFVRACEIPRKGELADEQVDRARGREQGEAADCEFAAARGFLVSLLVG
jgi:hypothetical protein